MKESQMRILIRNFVIELLVYAVLVIGYFLVVLRFLADPLNALFHTNLTLYGVLGLGLILVQAVVLEAITSFMLERLALERLR
ncbi:MAG: hypothetical protein ACE5LG_01810 [Anaerolineae bacterium]